MQRKLIWVGVIGCLVALGGCASPAEMAAQQHSADQAKCAGYGYQPGTDSFANCMMMTSQHRDFQNSMAQQQQAKQKQQQANQWERDKAAVEAADARHRADAQKMMNSGGGFTPSMSTGSMMPPGTKCTSTTTSQQNGNSGSSTTTTNCH